MNYSEIRRAPALVQAMAAHSLLSTIIRTHGVFFGYVDRDGVPRPTVCATPNETISRNPDDPSDDIEVSGITLADSIFTLAERLHIPLPFAEVPFGTEDLH